MTLIERLRECTCHEDYTKRKVKTSCQFYSGLHEEAADELVRLNNDLREAHDEFRALLVVTDELARIVMVARTISAN
jgi:hypothetical protein